MAESPLSFVSTESFRNSLMAKNLAPYNVPGVYSPQVNQLTYETEINVSNVIDSPGTLISNDPFAQQLYPLNQYGPDGGYNLNITYNQPPQPVQSNSGIYDPNDTKLDIVNEFYIDAAFIENIYGPEGGYNDMIVIDTIQNNNHVYLPYWDPPGFTPSSYSPYEILLSQNPVGTDGPLSSDSFIAKIGAQTLKNLFQERIDAEIYQNTVGTVNLESLSDPFEASLIATGQEPLVYRNWRITRPENPLLAAADFITRLGGAYWPVSPIPGDYFEENEQNAGASSQISGALNVTNQLTGGLLGPILNKTRNPSEIFLANTGNGQRSALFANLYYNRYQPGYDKNFGGLLGAAQAVVNLGASLIDDENGTLKGGYYVGSKNAEPSTITSPPNQIPVDPFGKQVQTPVYGPSELAILYEGNDGNLNFGLAGKSFSDDGGIDGGLVWVSPKSKDGAGYKATPGGGIGSSDEEFNQISSTYEKNESTNIKFKTSSILDQTQRLVDSADNVTGISRLKHVGNAINQVSKVFNDGYREMTKGSKVVSYRDFTTGAEEGVEYCRVFTKDTPYYTYADLQKTDGITTSGRRFTNSIFDNTYNLNIAPMRNPGSTNIIANDDMGRGGYAKKYMFSLENLAWRTSSKPGFTYDELPVCEKGPNGGRVMWFPPYDLTVSDSSTANWNEQDFIGRPEKIYTYKNTSRTGSLSWRILVDSPSVMNIIAEKQLKGANKERINSLIDSFFAGCVKYDIYELAKKFNTLKAKDIYTYQEILNNPRLTAEELSQVTKSIPKENTGGDAGSGQANTSPQDKATNPDTSVQSFKDKYKELAFYFENDIPKPSNSNGNFGPLYNEYTKDSRITFYQTTSDSIFSATSVFCKKTGDVPGQGVSYSTYCSNNSKTTNFFDTIIKTNYKLIAEGSSNFIVDAYNLLKEEKVTSIKVKMIGSASALGQVAYNKGLSKRRITAVKNFLMETTIGEANLKKYFQDKKIDVIQESEEGEGLVIPKGEFGSGAEVKCTDNITGGTGTVTDGKSQWYSVNAMACRRVKISDIVVEETPKKEEPPVETTTENISNPDPTQIVIPVKPPPTVTIEKKLKEGITKKILRELLTECDYFDVIQKEDPMLYDSIKQKIKYFNPAFHSMTPEGLNARLTFLQQCVRPGETIPIIGVDGKPKFNDAQNTAFGAPPILVLRIGDFYHTKIVPKGLQITYDPLLFDMNPEGIGVQPMTAKVTLSFDYIGGSGLAKPVEQLQNALSFNYYANTEIYDERAVYTEDTSAIDKVFEQVVLQGEEPATTNDVQNKVENDGGATIGDIITNIPVLSGQTGETSFQKFMDSLVDNTRDYFTAVVNTMEKFVLQSNYGTEQLVNQDRKNTEGDYSGVTPSKFRIYGEPIEVQTRIDKLFELVKEDITNDTNPILVELNTKDFNESVYNTVKTNMIDYVNSLNATFSNDITTILQEFLTLEQGYVQNLRKLNLIATKTDGKILDTGVPRVYILSGSSEVTENEEESGYSDTYDELNQDSLDLTTTLTDFNDLLLQEEIITDNTYSDGDFQPLTEEINDDSEDRRFFIVISRILNDKNKKQDFINSIIKGNLVNVNEPKKLTKVFEDIVDDISDRYSEELKEEEKLFEKFKKKKEYKEYTEGIEEKLYTKGKIRKFLYSTNITNETAGKAEFIKKLYAKKSPEELYKI